MNHRHDNEATEVVVSERNEPVKETPSTPDITQTVDNTAGTKRIKAMKNAASKDQSLAGQYLVTTNLNLRHGAGMSEQVMTVIPKNTKVRNYGFYTEVNGDKWLYVQVVLNNVAYTGFCVSDYLNKI